MEGGPSAPLPDGKAVAITVVRGPDTGVKYELTSSRIAIGRKRGDVLLKDRETSSLHASIEYLPDGRFILKDLGSTNGTWLEGKRVAVAEIRPGQHIKVGANHLLFAVVDAASEATTQGQFDERPGNVSLPSPSWAAAAPGPPPTLDLPRSPQAPPLLDAPFPTDGPFSEPPLSPLPPPPAWREPPSAPASAPWPSAPPPGPPPPPAAVAPVAPALPPMPPSAVPPQAAAPALPPMPPVPGLAQPPPAPAPATHVTTRTSLPPGSAPPRPAALPPLPPWPAAPPPTDRGTDISPARPLPTSPSAAPAAGSLPVGVERSVYGLYLVVERGRDRGKVFPVNRQVTVLGRSGTEILINDPDISRRHAALDVQGDGKYVLRDLNSTNGTLLNGVAINAESISANDKIRMGSTTIKLVMGDDRVAAELAHIAAEPTGSH